MMIEAHKLYKNGFDWRLSSDDIKTLNENTGEFEEHNIEYELINQYFKIPEKGEVPDELTATEIKIHLELRALNQKLNINKIGQQLKKLGFLQEIKRDGKTKRLYKVIKMGA